MKNIKFSIEPEIQEKILYKHGIKIEELMEALENGKPKIRRVKDSIYIAVTHYLRYITVYFEYEQGKGRITTAYPSQEWQVKMYHKK
mgnify:CR=1 FL=1